MQININKEIQELLKAIGPGRMSSVAYDTAWVARLGDIEQNLSNNALNWLCENQLPDGSWGAEFPFYYHDRVISTLAAMIALTYRGRRIADKAKIENGLLALERITSGATQGLQADPNGATVGFEMIVPALLHEAEKRGIIKRQGERILGRMAAIRKLKMSKLEGRKINRFVSPAFSAEMAGTDGSNILEIENLQENDGSVAHSPSATSYFAIYKQPGNLLAINYLNKWVSPDGGFPDFAPIDVFEQAWTLWNIGLIRNIDTSLISLCQPHLSSLAKAWNSNFGIGTASECTIKDSDDTSVVHYVLNRFENNIDINPVLTYEEEMHFRCFALEANPSISANIHVLGALRISGYDKKHPSVKKIINFLKRTRTDEGYWLDKWHASPYYTTSHIIILASTYDRDVCQQAIDWILRNQRADGSWGFYPESTAEETAYCIQSLCIWKQEGGSLPLRTIKDGMNWLLQHLEFPYHSLWIGKGLYCPNDVVKSAILSALLLANEI